MVSPRLRPCLRRAAVLLATGPLVVPAVLAASPATAFPALAKPAATATPVTVAEQAGKAIVRLKLAKKAPRNLTLSWSTVAGSAKAGSDFKAARGSVTVKKGSRAAKVKVAILDDTVAEPTETFSVKVKGAAKVRPAKVPVTILDDDGPGGSGPGGPGGPGATPFPQTIAGTVSGTTKTAVFSGGTVPDTLHVEWSGTITYVFEPNDPVLGTPWADQQVHYAVQAATVNWTASGSCTGTGTLTGPQLTGAFTVDVTAAGTGYDEDPAAWDYALYLAPVNTSAGNMPVSCGGSPSNAAGRVGQGGFGGALVYNGHATPEQPVSNRVSPDRYAYAGTANPPTLTYDNTWSLSGSGVAAYPPAG
ncbi:Calx-beta domain-containing protein [Nocardioides sp. LHD-245]|uniref:Calx-beta domain-containing protein n=1 Tax=Nocardioides sp. LHD-245 TaxID=3051387 RepID=UPI0027DFDD4C|nr:Calx-beta domain-containing protein [Nocardioides sp. LHD-245]